MAGQHNYTVDQKVVIRQYAITVCSDTGDWHTVYNDKGREEAVPRQYLIISSYQIVILGFKTFALYQQDIIKNSMFIIMSVL